MNFFAGMFVTLLFLIGAVIVFAVCCACAMAGHEDEINEMYGGKE